MVEGTGVRWGRSSTICGGGGGGGEGFVMEVKEVKEGL